MDIINSGMLSIKKRILTSQALCIIFAFINELHMRLIINNAWLFTNLLLFLTGLCIFIFLFTTLIRLFLDHRWANVLLVSFPYIIYRIAVLTISSGILPANVHSDDYGIGLICVFVNLLQWISIIIAAVLGTCWGKSLPAGK